MRWLGECATRLGVEIYAGFAGSEPIYSTDHIDSKERVVGVYTNDIGMSRYSFPFLFSFFY